MNVFPVDWNAVVAERTCADGNQEVGGRNPAEALFVLDLNGVRVDKSAVALQQIDVMAVLLGLDQFGFALDYGFDPGSQVGHAKIIVASGSRCIKRALPETAENRLAQGFARNRSPAR